MKKILTPLLLAFTIITNAQLTLQYQGTHIPNPICTSDGPKSWLYSDSNKTVTVYNLDYTVDHSFKVSFPANGTEPGVDVLIPPGVINNSSQYAVVIYYDDTANGHNVSSEQLLMEDGSYVIGGDSFAVNVQNPDLIGANSAEVVLTGYLNYSFQIYSTFGCLPQCKLGCSTLEGISDPQKSNPTLQAYPVPTTGKVNLTWRLPQDVSSGQITLFDLTGQPIRRISVNTPSGTIRDEPAVAPGTYYYRLSTSAGSTTRCIVVIK